MLFRSQYWKRNLGREDAPQWTFDGTTYDPTMLTALTLSRMKHYAEEQGVEIKKAVIACPAYYGMMEKNALKQAGMIAGINIVNIISEPTAAFLSYFYSNRDFTKNSKIIVYSLGGSSFDVTLLNYHMKDNGEPCVEIVSTNGDNLLGGMDWDNRLNNYICELYSEETGLTLEMIHEDVEIRENIHSKVEDVKHALSQVLSKRLFIKCYGDITLLDVSREKLEDITQDLVERTMSFVYQLIAEANFVANDIDAVLFVGGSTRMPMIKLAMEALFPGKVRVEQPELVVAKGAAIADFNGLYKLFPKP